MSDRTDNPKLKVVYLEDSPADRELVSELLKSENLVSETILVGNREEFEGALADGAPDLILSDYSLPSFDGLAALEIAKEKHPHVPFILLSGVMGEERAVESLKQGATDYVLKQRIERLIPCIRRALREIDERRLRQSAEEQLRVSEEQLRQITDNVSDLIVQVTQQGEWVYCSPSYRKLQNETAALPSKRFIDHVHPSDREAVETVFREVIRTGMSQRREFRLELADQTARHLESQFNVVCDEKGSVKSLIVVSRDITDRRNAEEQIRAQAALLDKAQDAIMVCDMNDDVVYWNMGAEHLYGWAASEVIGRNLHEMLHPEITQAIEKARDVLRHNGEWQGELRQTNRAEKEILVQSRWTLVKDAEGKAKSQLIINTDVTDKRITEAQFLRSQRLESLGALASGIAHDLNNMLSPIILASQLLRMRVDDTEGHHWLDTLESTTQRGASLIKQMLTFAKGEQGDRVEVSIGHLITEVATILKQTLSCSIQIQTTKAEDLWPVVGDLTQLHQVLMNLCVNARDAMPDGGRIHVSAENVLMKEDHPMVIRNGGRGGIHVLITVADTGSGMPPELIERAFEPFFTTKERGKGSGLGLTTVQTIVANNGGFVTVESEVNRGTRFRVYMPAVTSSPVDKPTQSSRPTLPRGDGETILLVDDEAAFREITQATLEKYGYRVLSAADGTEGLAIFMQNRNDIHLVMTDIMMPVMDGAALIRSLQKMDVKVKFIAISGLLESEKAAVSEAAPDVPVDFLPKPFSTESLLLTVNEVLTREEEN